MKRWFKVEGMKINNNELKQIHTNDFFINYLRRCENIKLNFKVGIRMKIYFIFDKIKTQQDLTDFVNSIKQKNKYFKYNYFNFFIQNGEPICVVDISGKSNILSIEYECKSSIKFKIKEIGKYIDDTNYWVDIKIKNHISLIKFLESEYLEMCHIYSPNNLCYYSKRKLIKKKIQNIQKGIINVLFQFDFFDKISFFSMFNDT